MKVSFLITLLSITLYCRGYSQNISEMSNQMCQSFSSIKGEITGEQSLELYTNLLEEYSDKTVYNKVHERLIKDCPVYQKFAFGYQDYFTTVFSNHEGTKFEDLTLVKYTGERGKLSNINPKVYLIDFWATWCSPCVSHIPDQIVLYDKFKSAYGDEFEWINISVDKDTVKWKSFLDEQYKPGLNYLGEITKLEELYHISRYPTFVLLNENLEIIGFEVPDFNFPSTEPLEYVVDMAIQGYTAKEAWSKVNIPGTYQETTFYQKWKKEYNDDSK